MLVRQSDARGKAFRHVRRQNFATQEKRLLGKKATFCLQNGMTKEMLHFCQQMCLQKSLQGRFNDGKMEGTSTSRNRVCQMSTQRTWAVLIGPINFDRIIPLEGSRESGIATSFGFFYVAACNAYILECEYRRRSHQRTRPQADFRLELGKSLINGYSYRKRPVNQVPAEEPRRDHQAVRLEGRKKECVLCKSSGRKTPKGYPIETKNKCQQCNVALCKVQCFAEYHGANA